MTAAMRRSLTAALLGIVLGAAAPADAAPKWTMVRSESLIVMGDQSASTLRNVAQQLEQFRVVVGGLLKNAQRAASLPTTVYVFGSHRTMETFVPLRNGKPMDVGGFFQHDETFNTIVLSMEDFDDGAAIVFHEYAHLLVRNAVRWLPTWLNEGLAEYYSTFAIQSDGKTVLIGRPVQRHLAEVRLKLIPLRELLEVTEASPLYNEGSRRSVFYAESWALVHYLLMAVPDGAAIINKYAAAMAAGDPIDAAFTAAFGKSVADVQRDLNQYLGQPTFKSMRYTLTDRIEIAPLGAARSMSEGETGGWLGDLQRRIERTEEARARIEAAVTADPAAASPHVALGLLRIAQGRKADAWPELEKATALAPEDFTAQFVYAVSLLREVARDEYDDDMVTRARAALMKAAALNPSSADTSAWLAYADMQDSAKLGEALSAITRAIALAPGRLEFRLRYADIAVLRGAIDTAKPMLTDLASARIDPVIRDAARKRLDTIARLGPRSGAADSPAESLPPADAALRSPSTSSGSASPDPAPPRESAIQGPVLRKVLAGEERAFGALVRVECGSNNVRFHVQTRDRIVIASAARMEDVDLTQFTDQRDFTLTCGQRTPPDSVYLTWRPRSARDGSDADIAGTAVAVEFMPKNYVPY
jgi:tetratricopeptide (TPR) repeat protein